VLLSTWFLFSGGQLSQVTTKLLSRTAWNTVTADDAWRVPSVTVTSIVFWTTLGGEALLKVTDVDRSPHEVTPRSRLLRERALTEVKGRKATSFFSIKDDLVAAGADWQDAEVVVDGNLITSRNPNDLPAFCRAIVQALTKA
jgi:putative intracellular protease/amidase